MQFLEEGVIVLSGPSQCPCSSCPSCDHFGVHVEVFLYFLLENEIESTVNK